MSTQENENSAASGRSDSKALLEPKAPSLPELKTRQCSLPELQAALVKLIECHNNTGEALQNAVHALQDASERRGDWKREPYGL